MSSTLMAICSGDWQSTVNSTRPGGWPSRTSSFGKFGGDLLVGNFGSGHINAYNPNNGKFEGSLRDASNHNRPLTINGLWGLIPGNDGSAGNTNTIYFTAGPGGESHYSRQPQRDGQDVSNGRVVGCGNGRKRARSAGASPTMATPGRPGFGRCCPRRWPPGSLLQPQHMLEPTLLRTVGM